MRTTARRPMTAAGLGVLALVMAWAVWQAPSAHALSCAMPDAAASVERSDVVVVGTIVEASERDSEGYLGPGMRSRAEVAVERYLKGAGPAKVTVDSATAAWAGGWDEEDIGQRWVFFLQGEGDHYDEQACSGSFALENEGHPLSRERVEAVTGPGVPPEPEGEASQPSDDSSALSLALGGAGTALLAGLGTAGLLYVRRL